MIELIDVASKVVIWTYGVGGRRGAVPGLLDYPDDAYQLPNGNVVVADIRNCRVLEIGPDKRIIRQYGKTGRCWGPDTLASPNGDKPLGNGHLLISTISDHALTDLTELVARLETEFSASISIRPTNHRRRQFPNRRLRRPGRIIEIDRQGTVIWDYSVRSGDAALNRPSLAVELPDGNIIANDDLNHRVIVIDKATKKIIWQMGSTGRPGSEIGYLSIPEYPLPRPAERELNMGHLSIATFSGRTAPRASS